MALIPQPDSWLDLGARGQAALGHKSLNPSRAHQGQSVGTLRHYSLVEKQRAAWKRGVVAPHPRSI